MDRDPSRLSELSASLEALRVYMTIIILSLLILLCLVSTKVSAFRPGASPSRVTSCSALSMSLMDTSLLHSASQFLADTSIGEEDVLAITGSTSELPDPKIAVGIAAVLFIGIGALQFTLGDLTKEEGQARVRDFLATRRDTERKRGYFD